MIIKDHKDNLNRELSLVEQKKMQWAKEREEMAKLEQYHSMLSSNYENKTIRTQLITNTNLEIVQQNNNFHQQKNFTMRRLCSPSLPPIDKTITRQGSKNSDQSSGYLSGSGGSNSLPPSTNQIALEPPSHFVYKYGQARLDGLNDKFHAGQQKKGSLTSSVNEYSALSHHEQDMDYNGHKSLGTPSSETSSIASHDIYSVSSYANSSAMDYQKGKEGGRAKWGSYLFDAYSKDNGRSSRTNGPNWLEKSLSEARDSEDDTMSISVQSVASFLRGQNVPMDPVVLAERESKRRKAMELQQAIKEQLQERENLKRLEKEKQYQLDKMEEERLAKQVGMDRKRVEYEQNIQFEKLESERKRAEVMRKALEKAALEAQMDKEKRRREKYAMQNTIDETISIQKIGEKTEIFIDQKPPRLDNNTAKMKNFLMNKIKESISESSTVPQTPAAESNFDDDEEEEDDGETVLIGTPIKLKKKNLNTFRRKFHKRQQQPAEESKNTSDDEVSVSKTAKSVHSDNNDNNQAAKVLPELDGIAFVLQSMPMVPFVPLSNELFSFNHLNNLAFFMATQNRMNSPNVMLPIASKDMTGLSINVNEKLDLSQFISPQNNQQTITLQIQQVEARQTANDGRESQAGIIQSVPPSPDSAVQSTRDSVTITEDKLFKSSGQDVPDSLDFYGRSVTQNSVNTSNSTVNREVQAPTPLPHDGTFTKEECNTHDAFTSTSTENRFVDEEREVKILTPQKYRNEMKLRGNSKTIGTQTESFLFCEYCSYQHQHHHHHHCLEHEEIDALNNKVLVENVKCKDKKSENRPLWGVRNPPVKYLKASERDPFYGKSRKKRYLKKALSESEKTDESCTHRDCPLVKTSTPLLAKRHHENDTRDNLSTTMLPIRTDRFGRICLIDEQNFIANETFRRIHSDAESSVDIIKHKSFFLPKANDFQDIFGD